MDDKNQDKPGREVKTIKILFENLNWAVHELSRAATEPDEFVACGDTENAVTKAKEVFKRTKDVDNKVVKEP